MNAVELMTREFVSVSSDTTRSLTNVQENSDRQSRRDRLPDHQNGAADGDRDGGGLFGGRCRGAACTRGRRGGIDRPAAVGRQLSPHRPDCRGLPANRRRSRASRLWVSVGAAGFRDRARRRRDRVHRPRPRGDRGDGRQDRLEAAGARGRRDDRARPSRCDRRSRHRRRDRPRHRLPGHAQGVGGRRRQGHAHRARRRRAARGLARRRERGARQFRRRPHLYREIYRGAAAHRDPGARRQARQHRASRRARMLDPAPPSEGHRGGAEPVYRP